MCGSTLISCIVRKNWPYPPTTSGSYGRQVDRWAMGGLQIFKILYRLNHLDFYSILLIICGEKYRCFTSLHSFLKSLVQLPAFMSFHSIQVHKIFQKVLRLQSNPQKTWNLFTANNKHYTLFCLISVQSYYSARNAFQLAFLTYKVCLEVQKNRLPFFSCQYLYLNTNILNDT